MQTQQPKRLSPQLGVVVSTTRGHSPSGEAPWYIVRNDDKRRGRLNAIAHILAQIPYKKIDKAKVKLPSRSDKRQYDDQAPLKGRRFIAEQY